MEKTKKVYCEDCGELIPQKRLMAVPSATKCVECLEVSGDVFKYRSLNVNVTSKTIGGIRDICRTKEQFDRLKEQSLDIDYSIFGSNRAGE